MFLRSRAKRQEAPPQAPESAASAETGDVDMRELARRVVPRDMIELLTLVRCGPETPARARIVDISPYGCQARAPGAVRERGDIVHILLPIIGEVEGHVMWGLKGLFGCKFDAPIDADLYPQMLAMIRDEGEDWSDHRIPGVTAAGEQSSH